ncbi:sigma-70 family RNA polymerase sigma factor [Pontibacter sp. G13]|uniref:RNA polymerase sigma factor n=1 Tax=Pontibacter sp. G13 TaxID=3074898 RepID=UPI00288B5CA0|nr:sigma-70 family RNA polymerase sigma factor [Pontibacter sp. G13]WNJ20988.1 sigma-70 family RNA polymerase sigma factor [Pontibacter sp. G13]
MEEASFTALIEEHQGIIHKVARMYSDDPEETSDLFQEILLQIWKSRDSFSGKSKVSTWMYRIALNTAISGLRKKKRRPQSLSLSEKEFQLPTGSGEWDREQQERTVFLHRAIDRLSKVEKAIIMLYLDSHSYEEIAEITGITPNHVGVKINRIKAKLRKWMTPHFS